MQATHAHEIQAVIEAIRQDAALYEEASFASRERAIDDLEFKVIDRLDGLLQTEHPPVDLLELKLRAERVLEQLQAVDDRLFRRLRADIRTGLCVGQALRDVFAAYVGRDSGPGRQRDEMGYDTLDVFVNGLLLGQSIPGEAKAMEPEMVSYQQTPARVILELVASARFKPDDVFYDLGSGLGHVPILTRLLAGVTAKGIEFEPAYCGYARACAADLNLSRVEFINADARTADLSDGTVFFMYTPFEGGMLHAVLAKLREEARNRRVRLFTYGPCTPLVARQSWLACLDRRGNHIHQLAAFRSL